MIGVGLSLLNESLGAAVVLDLCGASLPIGC